MKQLALIGPTASGKTALSITLAKALDGIILSLDSLALYREIDIASAKPALQEREGILHFGIDILSPNIPFDVTHYIKLYQEVSAFAQKESKRLIIVGGTSFYLKMLMEGISTLPTISKQTKDKMPGYLNNLPKTYQYLYALDPNTMREIASNDAYRIEKMLTLYLETEMTPSQYFAENPPQSVITAPLPLYEITMDRSLLRERIALRTTNMLNMGLIDEVAMLEKHYTRQPSCMGAIGIKETLGYLDGLYTRETLEKKIAVNTGRLAKRQQTFNRSQFSQQFTGNAEEISSAVLG